MIDPKCRVNQGTRSGSLRLASAIAWKVTRDRGGLLLFPVLFLGLCWPLQTVLVSGLRQYQGGNTGTLNEVVRGSINADILISGSSRAVYHYDPRIIEIRTGRRTFNIGRDGTKLDEQVAFLRTYLRHNRKPDTIIQNLDAHSLKANRGVTDPSQYMGWLGEDELYQNVRSHRWYFAVYRVFPLIGILREGSVKPALEGILGVTYQGDNRFAGYCPQDKPWNNDFQEFQKEHPLGVEWVVEEAARNTLREMLALCWQEEIRLILVYSPEYIDSQLMTKNRTQIFEVFRALASEYQTPLWDYSQDRISQEQEYFYNSQHLNQTGATLFSEQIGKRLETDYGLHPKEQFPQLRRW